MTATTSVTCNAGSYTQLTTSDTGYALIYNPADSGSNLAIYNGASAPAAGVETYMMLAPDQAFQRISDITGHIYGKLLSGNRDVEVVVTE